MTDQPTTWTPERALAWLKWGSNAFPSVFSVAIPALESAAAEIERLREENDEIRRENGAICVCKEALDKEVEWLRAELAAMTKQRDAYRNEVLDAKVKEHGKPAEAAQQGPSDREISDAVNSILTSRNDWERAQAIVGAFIALGRRAGVKL